MNERIDVLAVMDAVSSGIHYPEEGRISITHHELYAFLEARAAVAELIEADLEYEAARRDWDHVTAHDPEETSDETWQRVADRFEAAVMRRVAALARVGAP